MNKACWKNKKILITGAEGFVGSHFLAVLQKNGVKVVGTVLKRKNNNNLKNNIKELNVLDKKRLEAICKTEKINFIIHCAVLDGNPEFKKNNSVKIIEENIRMALNILNVASELKIKEVVILSSAEIYAAGAKNPIKEGDDYTKYFPIAPSGYATSKVSIEILASLYVKQFGLKVMLPRPTNIYGPGDKVDIKSSRVIPSMIAKILSDQEIEIWGDGHQSREFIYIEDLIKSIICLIEKGEFSAINLASGESISIKKLAKLISQISNKKFKIRFDKLKQTGLKKRILNISKLNSLIDFSPISLKEGLEKTIKAYKDII